MHSFLKLLFCSPLRTPLCFVLSQSLEETGGCCRQVPPDKTLGNLRESRFVSAFPAPFITRGKFASSSTAQAQIGISPHPEYVRCWNRDTSGSLYPRDFIYSAGGEVLGRDVRPGWDSSAVSSSSPFLFNEAKLGNVFATHSPSVWLRFSKLWGSTGCSLQRSHCAPSQQEMLSRPWSLRSATAAGITAACGDLLCLHLTGITLSLFL